MRHTTYDARASNIVRVQWVRARNTHAYSTSFAPKRAMRVDAANGGRIDVSTTRWRRLRWGVWGERDQGASGTAGSYDATAPTATCSLAREEEACPDVPHRADRGRSLRATTTRRVRIEEACGKRLVGRCHRLHMSTRGHVDASPCRARCRSLCTATAGRARAGGRCARRRGVWKLRSEIL